MKAKHILIMIAALGGSYWLYTYLNKPKTEEKTSGFIKNRPDYQGQCLCRDRTTWAAECCKSK